jgi:hypothetical protein
MHRLAYSQDKLEKQSRTPSTDESEDTQFPLVDYLDAHSGWALILPDVIKTAAHDEESIYSKKMKEKIAPDYKASQASLYTSLAAKIKSGGVYIGMLSGIGKDVGTGEKEGYEGVMMGSAYASLLGFDKPQ